MVDFTNIDQENWLALREASAKMGVSPATLHVWADAGRVESYRTPGGHRRFRVSERTAPFRPEGGAGEARWRLLEHAALGRVQLAREDAVTTAVPSVARAEQRELERGLIRLAARAVRGTEGIEPGAQELGVKLAKLNWRLGVGTREASRSLAMFRNAFLESVVEFAFGVGEPNADELSLWLGRANQAVDAVSESMLEYRGEETKKGGGRR